MYLSLNYQNSFILLSSHIFNTHTDFVANFKKPMKETSKGTCIQHLNLSLNPPHFHLYIFITFITMFIGHNIQIHIYNDQTTKFPIS